MRGASGGAAATVRIGVVQPRRGWRESPAGAVFGDHPAYSALESDSFVEASRLCFAAQARRDTFMRLLGNMAALSDWFSAKWLVACPRQEHASIYERLFGFRAMAEPRKYFGVDFETQLLATRREELRERVGSTHAMWAAWEMARETLRDTAGAGVAEAGVAAEGTAAEEAPAPAVGARAAFNLSQVTKVKLGTSVFRL
jgi:hypothetical protein